MRADGFRQSWWRRVPVVAGVAVSIAFMTSPAVVAGTAPSRHALIVSTANRTISAAAFGAEHQCGFCIGG